MGIVTVGAIFALLSIGCYFLFLSALVVVSLVFGYITAGFQISSGVYTDLHMSSGMLNSTNPTPFWAIRAPRVALISDSVARNCRVADIRPVHRI